MNSITRCIIGGAVTVCVAVAIYLYITDGSGDGEDRKPGVRAGLDKIRDFGGEEKVRATGSENPAPALSTKLEDIGPASRSIYYAGVFRLSEPNESCQLSDQAVEVLKLDASERTKVQQLLVELARNVSLGASVGELPLLNSNGENSRYVIKGNPGRAAGIREEFYNHLSSAIGVERAGVLLSALDIHSRNSATYRGYGANSVKLEISGAVERGTHAGLVTVEIYQSSGTSDGQTEKWTSKGTKILPLTYPLFANLNAAAK